MKNKQTGGTRQTGGFLMGLVAGLLLGLVAALGVALYVTKAPVPWVNKVPQRTAEQDAAEAERNKKWDPNAPLAVKPLPSATVPSAPAQPAAPAPVPTPAPANAAVHAVPAPAVAGRPASAPVRDPAAILAGKPATPPAGAASVSTAPGADPFTYFVQAGAYARTEDAEQQRARLAMFGMSAKVTEREQSGRTVFRVRVGPFDKKTDADAAKGQLENNGVEAALVRVQK